MPVIADGRDKLLVDTRAVDRVLSSLSITREQFLTALCRKVVVHRWIFSLPSEQAVLQVGEYFGVFSWQTSDEPVNLNRLMRLKDKVSQEWANVFGAMVVSYNDMRVWSYRTNPGPASGLIEEELKVAIKRYYSTHNYYLTGETRILLDQMVPAVAKACTATMHGNLAAADAAFHQGDLGRTVAYLEASLTSFHDLVDAVTSVVADEVA